MNQINNLPATDDAVEIALGMELIDDTLLSNVSGAFPMLHCKGGSGD